VSALAKRCYDNASAERLPLLLCGKTRLEGLPLLTELCEEGLLVPPRYLPSPFTDLSGLKAWLDRALPN
jgi:hypothetical protein